MSKVTLASLRTINWGASYSWEVVFEGAPAPFNTFFPAVNITFPVYKLDEVSWNFAQGALVLPQNEGVRGIQLSFLDEEKEPLVSWLVEWVKSITKDGCVAYMDGSGIQRKISIVKVLKNDVFDKPREYKVVPRGELSWVGSQASTARQFTQGLIILEDMNK